MANLVVSPFFLHWTNDIQQAFREVYRVLIPDGFFTGAMFACNTLKELHHPQIVSYVDRYLDKARSKIFIIMEYCENGDLARYIKRHK